MTTFIPLLTLVLQVALHMLKRMERESIRNEALSQVAAEINKVVNHADVINERVSTADDEYLNRLHDAIEKHRAASKQLDLFSPTSDPLKPKNGHVHR